MTERAVPTGRPGPPTGPAAGDRPAGHPARGHPADRTALLERWDRPGPPPRAELARLTDGWLAALFDPAPPGTALVATGGYGRGELSPGSDLDLLLLHDGADPEAVAELADRVWYPVWDLGPALDHAVRTPAEARAAAGADLRVHLGLLDARHLAGDPGLTAALRGAALGDWRAGAARRLPELRESVRRRAERHGDLAHLLEPDLKEARGGLRDATVLCAVAASWIADAPREGLERARADLLDARDALHLATGRATDRLTLQDQDQVAARLGLPDADALLRRLYEAARTVGYAGDVTWRAVDRVLRARERRPRRPALLGRGRGRAPAERVPLANGVVEQDGEAVLARAARPEHDPVLPLRAAAAAAQADLPLSPHAVRALAAAPPLPVPWPAEAREQLVTLLGAGRSALPVWEALEAGGLVTGLLPDWERVRCRPQRNAVHRWTVDRHLVETAVHAGRLARDVARPDLLLVAALLHDLGKGRPGDHRVTGERLARAAGVRMGFGRADTAVLALLVRHHLLLVETATRRDLDDPATVASVAAAVGSRGTLALLRALTEADALATGPAAWSAWRAGLVADLAERTAAVLAGEEAPTGPATGPEHERLAAEAARTGRPALLVRARPEPPPQAPDGGAAPDGGGGGGGGVDGPGSGPAEAETAPLGVELLLAVSDRPGLLPAAAGVLALHRLTVRAADLRRVEPAGAGPVTLLSWRVAAQYGGLPEAARLRADLARALDGSLDIASRLAEREAAQRPRRSAPAPAPRVTVLPGTSDRASVIEVRAHDRPGLLHRIGEALERVPGTAVRAARISTLGSDAVDAFYLVDPRGAPLSPEQARRVARRVEDALG